LNQVCFSVTIRSPSFQEYPLNTDASGTAPPDAFGPFRVLHQIGAGALGPVFRAYQPEQDRLVAVKVLRIDLPPERTYRLVSQFEQLIAADLTHAGIAAPLATGLSDVSAFLAMDFVAADSLDIVIRNQELSSPSDAVRVAAQLASALDLAAAIEITHGALHPRDILLSADDVRVTGIGIVRALEEVGFSAPVRRPYTAPERAGGQKWDRRADVFSLAALVFELLTRRRISGPGDQPFDAYARISGVSADALAKVFDRALAERPGDRFATAGDFAKALQAAVERKRSATGRVGAAIRTPIPEPPVEPSTPVPVEELPLFTDSLLNQQLEATVPGVLPPMLLDPSHDHVEPDFSFRAAPPPSIAESLHELDTSSNRQGRSLDVFEAEEMGASSKNRLTLEDFSDTIPIKPPSPRPEPVPQRSERPMEPSRHFAFTERAPEFEVGEGFSRDGEIPAREAQFESIESGSGRASSGVWPLMLALVVGIALGFGMAMLLLGRDRVSPAPQQAAVSNDNTRRPAAEVRDEPIREVTEQTVATAPKPALPAPAPVASAAPPPSVSPQSPANAKPAAEKPAATTPAAERPINRGASSQSARPQPRPPVSATKTTPSKPVAPARSGPAPAPSRGVNRSESPTPKPLPQTPAPKPRTGSLAIDSRPPGADVYVDGRRVGSTPLVLGTMKVGEYTIGLDLDGYKRWATTVKVTEEERSRVAASLER